MTLASYVSRKKIGEKGFRGGEGKTMDRVEVYRSIPAVDILYSISS